MSHLLHGPKGLFGNDCHCGGKKAQRQSFCGACYVALPPVMRKSLYRSVGEGYEEAHAAALVKLRDLGRVRDEQGVLFG